MSDKYVLAVNRFSELSDPIPSFVNTRDYPDMHQPIVILKDEALYIDPTARIDSFVKLECGEGTYIGRYVHIASFCHLGIGGGLMVLEDGSSCGSGAKIITGSNIAGPGRGCSAISPNAVIKRSFVHLKENATLYCGAIVLPGVTIGVGSVIAAGSVVNRDVPDGELWGGVPAHFIKRVGEVKSADLVPGAGVESFVLGPLYEEDGELHRDEIPVPDRSKVEELAYGLRTPPGEDRASYWLEALTEFYGWEPTRNA